MRVRGVVLTGLLVASASLACGTAAAAGRDENPDGFGIYSPLDRKGRVYRYDARSWYYRQPRYYPYYASNYWVPRAYMRYRYRYLPYGTALSLPSGLGLSAVGKVGRQLLPPVEVVTR